MSAIPRGWTGGPPADTAPLAALLERLDSADRKIVADAVARLGQRGAFVPIARRLLEWARVRATFEPAPTFDLAMHGFLTLRTIADGDLALARELAAATTLVARLAAAAPKAHETARYAIDLAALPDTFPADLRARIATGLVEGDLESVRTLLSAVSAADPKRGAELAALLRHHAPKLATAIAPSLDPLIVIRLLGAILGAPPGLSSTAANALSGVVLLVATLTLIPTAILVVTRPALAPVAIAAWLCVPVALRIAYRTERRALIAIGAMFATVTTAGIGAWATAPGDEIVQSGTIAAHLDDAALTDRLAALGVSDLIADAHVDGSKGEAARLGLEECLMLDDSASCARIADGWRAAQTGRCEDILAIDTQAVDARDVDTLRVTTSRRVCAWATERGIVPP